MNKMPLSFYLREYGKASFEKRQNQIFDEKLISIKTDGVFHTQSVFCPVHKKWEKAVIENMEVFTECGVRREGYPVEIPKVPSEEKESLSKYKKNLSSIEEKLHYKRKIDSISLLDYMTTENHIETLKKETENFYDKKGSKKDIFAFQLYTDEIHCCINLDYFMFDRKIIDSNMFNPKINPPFTKHKIFFKFDDKIKIPSEILYEQEKKEISYWEKPKKYKKYIFDLDLPENAKEQIHSVLNSYVGKSITMNTVLTGEDFFNGLFYYPYEPNFYEIEKKLKDFLSSEDKRSSDVFNKAMDVLEIKSYPTIRKLFYKNPISLLAYKKIHDCGFSDINIINSILYDESSLLFVDLPFMPLAHFSKFLLEKHPEKSTWNIMKKNYLDKKLGKTELSDALEMFFNNFQYVTDEIKKSISRDGMTLYNHDLLSKLTWNLKHANISFIFTKEQLSLEDEIDDYKFLLPKSSDELRILGSKLHNCVASYQSNVISGECTIVFAQKNDEYRLCIEVHKKSVWQERADRNTTPKGKDREVLEKWKEKHKLKS